MAVVLKTTVAETLPGVRIPLLRQPSLADASFGWASLDEEFLHFSNDPERVR